MSPSRNAQVGQSFTWLFTIIAGAAFLLIFYQVAQMQTSTAREARQENTLNYMSSITHTLYTSQDTNRTLPGLPRPFNLTCVSDEIHYVLPDGTTQSFTDHPIYVPSQIPANEMRAVTATYEAPLPVTSILYFIPRGTTIPYPSNEENPPRLDSFLEPTTTTPSTTISLDTAHGSLHKAGYILTNDSDIINCTKDAVYSQAQTTYKTLRDKAQHLLPRTPNRCNDSYTAANTTLRHMINITANFTDPTMFQANVSALQRQNNGLIQDSCPSLY